MNIKGTFAKVDSQTIWELATHVIEYNEKIIERTKTEIEETKAEFEAKPWWYKFLFDKPYCYQEHWKIDRCEDAVDHATNLVRLCVNTTDDIFLSPQDAAFIGLKSENDV